MYPRSGTGLISLCTNPVSILSVLFKPSVEGLNARNRLIMAGFCLVAHSISKPRISLISMSSAFDFYQGGCCS
jgi:hypothetical protein